MIMQLMLTFLTFLILGQNDYAAYVDLFDLVDLGAK